jgi:hypothetical protein
MESLIPSESMEPTESNLHSYVDGNPLSCTDPLGPQAAGFYLLNPP